MTSFCCHVFASAEPSARPTLRSTPTNPLNIQASAVHDGNDFPLSRRLSQGNEYGTEKPAEARERTESGPNYCQEHRTEHKLYEGDSRVWYSQKTSDGKWCKEK